MKPQCMWALRSPRGGILWIMPLRWQVTSHWSSIAWKRMYRKGYRCVRVTVQEIPKTT